jgi:alpha-mannosidase
MLATLEAQMPGLYSFDYAVLPYAGEAQEQAFGLAAAFQVPLRIVVTTLHAGGMAVSEALFAGIPDAFQVTAFKPAEDGEGWILRGVSHAEEPLRFSMRPWRKFHSAEAVRLDEERLGVIPLAEDGSFDVEAQPHQVVSVRLRG